MTFGEVPVADRKPKQQNTEVDEVPAEEGDGTLSLVELSEYVDRAIKDLRNEISALKEQVADLERIVTQPSGSVQFLEVGGASTPNPPPEDPLEESDISWYTPDY